MKKILISTITPCYRMKKYLKVFLEQLPRQTIFNKIEIILDHNEPSDYEIGLVKDFQIKYPGRLKHIIIPKVDPISISMNRCIKESTGEFLAMWSIDDLRSPDSLEMQMNTLLGRQEIGFVTGPYFEVDSFPKTQGKYVDYSKLLKTELTRNMILGPFFMFRKDLCQKIGYFDEQLKVCADYDFAIRLSLHSRGLSIKDSLGYYLNERKGNSTRPGSVRPIEDVVIRLRYGVYDIVDYNFLPKAIMYDILNIVQFGKRYKISKNIKDYDELIRTRRDEWFESGLRNSYLAELKRLGFIKIINKIKNKFISKK